MNYELINKVSSVGLILDILGVLLLFRYGLPSKIKLSSPLLALEESTQAEKERNAANKTIQLMAHFGLALILIGFVCHLIGTNISVFE